MKINWKYLATTEGYISLQAKYHRELASINSTLQRGRQPMRNKQYFRREFMRIIDRAKHIHCATGEPMEDILNRWENAQTYGGLLNYHVLGTKVHKNHGGRYRGCRAYIKEIRCRNRFALNKRRQNSEVLRVTKQYQMYRSTKSPKRWETKRK